MDKLIVLKTIKTGESDLIVHALNSKGQKISLIAKGALQSKRRFQGGVLQPTHFINAIYSNRFKSASNQLFHLHEAQLINGFEKNRLSYETIQLSLWVIQTVDSISREGTIFSDSLFHLTGNALKIIPEVKYEKLFRTHFLIKLLHEQGVLKREDWMISFLASPLLFHNKINHPHLKKTLPHGYFHSIEQQFHHYTTI